MSTQLGRSFKGKLSDCEQDEDHKEYEFDYGAFATDDLEEDEEDTSLISVVKRILAAPKVEEEGLEENFNFSNVGSLWKPSKETYY